MSTLNAKRKKNFLTVGASRTEMTPSIGVPTGGGGPDGYIRTESVLDPLYMRACFISDGNKAMIIIQADVLGFSRTKTGKMASAIADTTGVSVENIVIACPQTHNSGTTFNEEFPDQELTELAGEEHRKWNLSLDSIATKTALKAMESATEVSCRLGRGLCNNVASGRRGLTASGKVAMAFSDPNPEEIISWSESDPEIICIRFDDLDTGKPIAGIWHYTSHPNCIWMLPHFSRDYPGVVEDALIKGFGNNFVPIFLNGFCGDVDTYRNMNVDKYVYTYPFYKEPGRDLSVNISEMHRLGSILGESVLNIMREASRSHYDWTHVEILRQQIECQIRKDDQDSLYSKHFEQNVEIVIMRLGPVALACAPFEPMASMGLAIKKASPAVATITVGHCPYYIGYLPDNRTLKEGGMESTNSWRGYADGTSEKLQNALIQGLNNLFKQ